QQFQREASTSQVVPPGIEDHCSHNHDAGDDLLFPLGTNRQQPVAADVSRRILSAARMAPTDVGGYVGMKCSG
ncbi:MAG: hypothetical protein NTW21_35745, partial [Verrucomicrobia bacterium]|nr:hypothetical protein [Verrucomicrobiota bacterium]